MNNVLRRTPQFRLIITVEGQSPPRYQVFRFSPGGHYRVGLPDGYYQVDMAKKTGPIGALMYQRPSGN